MRGRGVGRSPTSLIICSVVNYFNDFAIFFGYGFLDKCIMTIFQQAAKTIEKYNMLRPGEKVLAALSGGADSVCLTYVLLQMGYRVYALHVNHMLRGDEAKADKYFAEEFCEKLKIPLFVKEQDVKSIAKERGVSVEEGGRLVRYEALTHLALQLQSKIAVGHNKDDGAQTILFNLIRGTGAKGLRGIPPMRDNIVRPLIEISRKDIEEFCRTENIDYRTDGSNRDINFTKNKIRYRLLPVLKEINPNIVNTLTEMGDIMKIEDDFLSSLTKKVFADTVEHGGESFTADIPKLLSYDKALQRRVLASFSVSAGSADFTHKHIKALELLIKKPTGYINLPSGKTATVSYGKLIIEPSAEPPSVEEFILNIGDFICIGNNIYISLEKNLKKNKKDFLNTCTKVLNYDKISMELKIRTRKASDKLYIKNSGTQKLKKYFINKKIPKKERQNLLLAHGNDIVWIFDRYFSSLYEGGENKLYLQLWRTAC